MQSKNRAVHLIITNLIRLILLLTFIVSLTSNRTLVQAVALIALTTTFIPLILDKIFKINVPSIFEVMYLMFLYGLLILGELRGFYHGFLWWDILMTFTASLVLGFTGLSVIHVLHKTKRINTSPLLSAILIFSFALSLSTLWELFEFTLDTLIHSGLQKNLIDTMQDLAINTLGALIVSIAGYNHIRTGKSTLTSTFLTRALEKNPILLGPKRATRNPAKKVKEIMRIGETNKIEFKSTLRTNLYTKQKDKRMELSVLKTITAFMNTRGGVLLIGIDDEKEIIGIRNDNFQNEDKANLHLTNLIKYHIGNEFLPFIKSEIINIEDRKIIMVTCAESKKRVFLKHEGKEEFYIRNGPASMQLEGNSLIDYINNKFKE